jgi:hydroxylaminobenzene mutase
MQRVLFTLGLVLFLVGLLTGFAVPALKNPRMALSSHLEAVLNGMFLVLLGLLWPHIDLPKAWGGYRAAVFVALRAAGRPAMAPAALATKTIGSIGR